MTRDIGFTAFDGTELRITLTMRVAAYTDPDEVLVQDVAVVRIREDVPNGRDRPEYRAEVYRALARDEFQDEIEAAAWAALEHDNPEDP